MGERVTSFDMGGSESRCWYIYIVNIDAACLLLRIDAKVSGDVVIGLC